MSLINRVPKGLQDLLGSKNFGKNPAELLQQVRAAVDLLPFWAVEKINFARTIGGGAITAGSAATSTAVPTGEIWGVIESACNVTKVTTGNLDLAARLTNVPVGLSTGQYHFVTGHQADTQLVGGRYRSFIWKPAQLVFIEGGTLLEWVVQDIGAAAAGDSYEATTRFYRFTV